LNVRSVAQFQQQTNLKSMIEEEQTLYVDPHDKGDIRT
jgi:hypothetical protein